MGLSKIHEYEYDKMQFHDSTNGIWYAASDGHKSFFLKKFKEPKYPSQSMLADPKCKEFCSGKKAQCEEWFSMRKRVITALRQKGNGSGNIVFAKEFFREGTSYYNVTEWIDIKNPSIDEISRLSETDKVFLLKTYSSALKKVHDVGIIHGDLKPDNVLVASSSTGRRIAKLIDFDDSYFSKEALSPDMTKSTPPYKSPELAAYIVGKIELRDRLTCASDIFASGLIFHEFWCGSKPKFNESDGKFFYQAIIAGEEYELDSTLPSWLHDLIADMLQREPEDRPTMDEVYEALSNEKYSRRNLSKGYKRSSASSFIEVYDSGDGSHTPSVDYKRLKSIWEKIPKNLSGYKPESAVKNLTLICEYLKTNLKQLTQEQVDVLASRLEEGYGSLKKPVFSGKVIPASPLPKGCRKVEIISDSLVKIYLDDGRTMFKTKDKALEGGFVIGG